MKKNFHLLHIEFVYIVDGVTWFVRQKDNAGKVEVFKFSTQVATYDVPERLVPAYTFIERYLKEQQNEKDGLNTTGV